MSLNKTVSVYYGLCCAYRGPFRKVDLVLFTSLNVSICFVTLHIVSLSLRRVTFLYPKSSQSSFADKEICIKARGWWSEEKVEWTAHLLSTNKALKFL